MSVYIGGEESVFVVNCSNDERTESARAHLPFGARLARVSTMVWVRLCHGRKARLRPLGSLLLFWDAPARRFAGGTQRGKVARAVRGRQCQTVLGTEQRQSPTANHFTALGGAKRLNASTRLSLGLALDWQGKCDRRAQVKPRCFVDLMLLCSLIILVLLIF